ncbi:unnamed protein product [Blepharisma stoltei]|uniref:Structural maintenance of chromosomes protein n=1 Tax=Blepharisma stoltei TaxID=1481888 RepID=A0AAU9JNZ5_9CILI|nr:unnamed protein product [Blepharisma stoltei]
MEDKEIPPRLMIHKVVLENFKSYAGIKEIGPFHKSFTSVVGPNGSGKSNLLECLLFAFGKRAAKMRLKKLSELIHHSHSFPDLKSARVSVYFQDILDTPDGYDIIPNSGLVLTRIVSKDGSSQYKLDGNPSTHEEVTQVLKLRGIDLEHNRFLILQGEVEQIAMMKPKAPIGEEGKIGLLEYLEEIIGTNVYVPLIDQAETELEGIADEVTAQKLRVEEAQKALDHLEGPKNEALAYIELEKELYDIRNLRNFLGRHQFKTEESNFRQELIVVEGQLLETENRFKEKKNLHMAAIQEYEEKIEQVATYSREEKRMKSQLEEAVKRDQELIENQMFLKNKKAGLEKEKLAEEKRKNEIRESLGELSQILPDAIRSLEETKHEKERVDEEYHARNREIIAATEELQLQKSSLERQLLPFKKQYDDCKSKVENTHQRIEFLVKERAQEDVEFANIANDIESCQKNLEAKTRESEEIELKCQRLHKDDEARKKKFEELSGESDAYKKQLASLRKQLEEAEQAEKKAEGKNRLLQEISTAKRIGQIQGVLGRLGDLGRIDARFDIAISSACPRLDNLVVESVHDADMLLDFVRQRNLGKITIIVLDKVQSIWEQKAKAHFRSPDDRATRLFDQIQYDDPRLISAFYFAMTDTLVADTMDDARRIAFGGSTRHRVVTLSGEIINPSGEMQGFAKPRRGIMSLVGEKKTSFSPEDMDLLHQKIKEANDRLNSTHTFMKNVQGEIAAEQKQKDQAFHQLKIIQSDLQGMTQRLTQLIARQKELQEIDHEGQEEELEDLKKLEEANEKAMKKIEILIETKKKEVEQIEKQIDDIGGDEFKAIKIKRQHLAEAEDHLEVEVNKYTKKLGQCKKDHDKIAKKLQELIESLEKIDQNLRDIESEREELRPLAESLIQKHEHALAIRRENEAQLKELEKAQEALKKEFEEILKVRDEIKAKRKEISSTIKRIEAEIDKWDQRINKNREDYEGLIKEYQDIMGDDMIIESVEKSEENEEKLENPRKRMKIDDERKTLRFHVNKNFLPEELESLLPKFEKVKDLEAAIQEELRAAKPNITVIQEYRARLHDKRAKENDLNAIRDREDMLKKKYNELKSKRYNEFNTGFTIISQKLRDMYRMITRGGDAELEFADSTDPFAEGIVFTVRPPNKSWKKMANLSGGEKTLSSLSLVFALHHYKPNALYVMDEVDAALDFQNVSVIANYIKGRTKNAQFIIVSLRYQMFELADRLVGVYKTNDVSHTIAISPCALVTMDSENPIIRQTVNNITL